MNIVLLAAIVDLVVSCTTSVLCRGNLNGKSYIVNSYFKRLCEMFVTYNALKLDKKIATKCRHVMQT